MGQGTLVCLYLPRHAEKPRVLEPLAPDHDRARRSVAATVLVVDDDPTVRMLVADLLQDHGCVTLQAQDGISGLKILESDARIDLLISHVGLPGGMTGRQLADAARARRPDLKFLFITGYADKAVLRHGDLDSGMHLLIKPFSMDILSKTLEELILEGST